MNSITITNVSKSFKVFKKSPGLTASLKSLFSREYINSQALKEINLTIPQGQIIGLVGANGAGKTTLIKILTGIISADTGSVSVLGFNPWDRDYEFRRSISLIMGQKAQLWWDLPAEDCFELLRDIYSIPHLEYKQTLEQLVEMLEVKDQINTQIRRLSLGERMKMELIAALLHRPKIIFLDEPTIGLDITSQRTIRNFLLQYRKESNATLLLTSHYMEDIEALCKRVVVLRKGAIVFDGSPQEIASQNSTKIVQFSLNNSLEEIAQRLSSIELSNFTESKDGSYKVRIEKTKTSEFIGELLLNFVIDDLLIEEDDISITIEKLMRGRGGVSL